MTSMLAARPPYRSLDVVRLATWRERRETGLDAATAWRDVMTAPGLGYRRYAGRAGLSDRAVLRSLGRFLARAAPAELEIARAEALLLIAEASVPAVERLRAIITGDFGTAVRVRGRPDGSYEIAIDARAALVQTQAARFILEALGVVGR